MRARARLGNRGAVPRAGGRRPGPGPHTGGTHIQYTYVQAHVSGSLRAGTRRQGHGRHRRTYSQGGDSDWAALRALRAVEAPPGSWAKIARTHESGISFGRLSTKSQPRTGHTREPDPTHNELKHTITYPIRNPPQNDRKPTLSLGNWETPNWEYDNFYNILVITVRTAAHHISILESQSESHVRRHQ